MNPLNRSAFLRLLFGGTAATAALIVAPSPPPPGSTTPRWVLNRCPVAGFAHHDGPRLRAALRPGDVVAVRAEFDNPHDRNALALHAAGHRIGYVPRAENRHLARLIRQGARLEARILEVRPEPELWMAVRVEISLVNT